MRAGGAEVREAAGGLCRTPLRGRNSSCCSLKGSRWWDRGAVTISPPLKAAEAEEEVEEQGERGGPQGPAELDESRYI